MSPQGTNQGSGDAAFTPGPWEAFHRPQGVGITGEVAADFVIPASLGAEERECVADYAVARCLTSLNGFDPVAERASNARLIAAAPELYRELQAAGTIFRAYEALHLEKGTEDGNEKAKRNAAFAETIERALAKARGQ